MKKKKTFTNGSFARFLPLVGMMFIVSCHSLPETSSREKRHVENETDNAFSPKVVMSENVPMDPAPGYTGPRMLINISIQSVPVQGTMGKLIQDVVFDGFEAETYGENLIAEQRAQYREAGQIALAEADFVPESWNWEYTETVEGVLVRPDRALPGIAECLAVSKNRDYYLGGAHGMSEKLYFMFDRVNFKLISLDDVIREDAHALLQQLIAARLRDHAGIGQDAPLTLGGFFEDEVEITANFFLTSEGVAFHWDPYEIAPYVMGAIEIVLPYGELKDILR
jgi:hypothetical protein